jgi:hypothetical protein
MIPLGSTMIPLGSTMIPLGSVVIPLGSVVMLLGRAMMSLGSVVRTFFIFTINILKKMQTSVKKVIGTLIRSILLL